MLRAHVRPAKAASRLDHPRPACEQRLAELELIYDAAPVGIFLCDRDFRFIRVNRHLALEIDGLPVEEHIGRVVWEVVPGVRSSIEPLLRRVLDLGATISKLEVEGETQKAPGARRVWEVSCYPVRDENGAVVAISGLVDEITDRKTVEKAQAEERARLQRLLDANLFGVLTGVGERVTDANDAFLDLVGYSREDFQRHGLEWQKITPPEHRLRDAAAVDTLKETGICRAYEKEYIRTDGRRVPILIGATLLDREPFRWIAFVLDLSSRKAKEQHIRHLLQELTHRTNNLITVIQAMAHQVARTSTSLGDFADQFSARLKALAGIHSLLVQDNWRGAQVRELVLSQVAHCGDLVGKRILLDGPPVSLMATACQYIGMALYELCTNALKYGALSNDTGTVTIRWLPPDERSDTFRIDWIEAGGPVVERPTREGFGHRVVTKFVARALDAKVSYGFRKEGLRWSLAMPPGFLLDGDHGRHHHATAPAPVGTAWASTPLTIA